LLQQFGVDPQELARRLGRTRDDDLSHSRGTDQVPGAGDRVSGTEDDYEGGLGDGGKRTRA
jgi:hypothetical protein